MSYTINRKRKVVLRINTGDDSPLMVGWTKNDWSAWHDVMKPTEGDDRWERREGNDGYRLRSRHVSDIFGQEREACGIYEFRAMRGRTSFVVFVGCSCKRAVQSLPGRINQYCADGSHKNMLINDALKKGYTLSFRYKRAVDMAVAQADENLLLVHYTYSWNVRTVPGLLPP